MAELIDKLLMLAIPLVGWLVKRSQAKDDAKAKFFEFVEAVNSSRGDLVDASDAALSQREKLKKQIEDEKRNDSLAK